MSNTFSTSPIKDNSDGVIKFLKTMERDVKDSHEMASMGVHTQLARFVSDLLTNPFQGMVGTFNAVQKSLVNFLDEAIVKRFLNSNKDIILKVYHARKDYDLSYYVILTEDNSNNRQVFFEFLENYEFLDIDQQIPISFMFLPKEAISDITLENEIVLD